MPLATVDNLCYPEIAQRRIGTEGSRGYYPRIDRDKPHPAAILVSFGADYITTRKLNQEQETLAKAQELLDPKYKQGDWIANGSAITAWRIVSAINFLAGETVEDAYQKVLHNEDRT